MAHPFPSVTDQSPLRTLTDSGIAHYRKLNERDEKELELLRAERARLVKEIDSIDDVMTDLHETIGRREAKMRGDVIKLLPAETPRPGHEFEPGLDPDREAAALRFNAAHDSLSEVES